jgi:hypothetical protein
MTAHEILKGTKAVGQERGWYRRGGQNRDEVCIIGASNVAATGARWPPTRLDPEHKKALTVLADCAGARDDTFVGWWWQTASPAERERVLDRAIEISASDEGVCAA